MKLARMTFLTSIVLTLCFLSTVLRAANKKICVLADIHVMAPTLLDNENNKEYS